MDCIADFGPHVDGTVEQNPRAVICGVMEHIEEAGIHRGDSACALPPYSLPPGDRRAEIKQQTRQLAERLSVRGLMNVQYAVKDGAGLHPRGQPARLADRAVRLQGHRRAVGQAGRQGDGRQDRWRNWASREVAAPGAARRVKEVGLPVHQVPRRGRDPRARRCASTGEVMGIDMSFGLAFAKSQMAAGSALPTRARCFISVRTRTSRTSLDLRGGWWRWASPSSRTDGTHESYLAERACRRELDLQDQRGPAEHRGPDQEPRVALIINTPDRKGMQHRRGPHPRHGRPAQHPDDHHAHRRRRRGPRHRRAAEGPLGRAALQDYFRTPLEMTQPGNAAKAAATALTASQPQLLAAARPRYRTGDVPVGSRIGAIVPLGVHPSPTSSPPGSTSDASLLSMAAWASANTYGRRAEPYRLGRGDADEMVPRTCPPAGPTRWRTPWSADRGRRQVGRDPDPLQGKGACRMGVGQVHGAGSDLDGRGGHFGIERRGEAAEEGERLQRVAEHAQQDGPAGLLDVIGLHQGQAPVVRVGLYRREDGLVGQVGEPLGLRVAEAVFSGIWP